MTEKIKKFKVYHSKSFSLNSLLHFNTEGYSPFEEDYEKVAEVYAEGLEDVFYFTNHIDSPWFGHSNVVVYKESRSTSVGDLVEDEDGQLFFCDSFGWKKIDWNDGLKSDDKWWIQNENKYKELVAQANLYK